MPKTGKQNLIGIAKETSYGVAASMPTFFIPSLTPPVPEIVQQKVMLDPAMGTVFTNNAVRNGIRYAKLSVETFLDENVLPLLLMQNYTVSTAAVTGETAVYKHTLNFSHGTVPSGSLRSFTVFYEEVGGVKRLLRGCAISGMSIEADVKEVVKVKFEIIGISSTSTVSVAATDYRSFIGTHANLYVAESSTAYGNALPASKATLNLSAELTGEDENFSLGSQDMQRVYTKAYSVDLQTSVIKNLVSSLEGYYNNNNELKFKMVIEDTTRFVQGSAANTRPQISIEVAQAYMTEYKVSGGLAEVLKEDIKLIGVAGMSSTSPVVIEVVNSVATY